MIKTLNHKLLYENKWVRYYEDEVEFPNGEKGIYAYQERVDSGPMIIPFTSDGKVLVLKEWRYPIKNWTWCFPFGGVENNENILDAAKRELLEETGYSAEEWINVGTISIDPGSSNQVTPVFLAQNLTKGESNLEASEIHQVHELSVDEIDRMIQSGEIDNGWLLAGWSKLKIYLNLR